jgi:hypothetical protein
MKLDPLTKFWKQQKKPKNYKMQHNSPKPMQILQKKSYKNQFKLFKKFFTNLECGRKRYN